jgi:hypothetical protein
MSDTSPFLVLEQTCDDAVDWIIEQFDSAGLQAIRTFDLVVARQANIECPCPHHGTDQCDCQLVVLLVYKPAHVPISIIAHGYDGQTWFSVVDTPQQRADPMLEDAIRHAIIPRASPPANLQTVGRAPSIRNQQSES